MKKFDYPTPEQRIQILKENGENCDRRIREKECAVRSGLSRSRRWQLEKEGAFPARVPLGKNSVSWLLSDVLWWVKKPPEVEGVTNPHVRRLMKTV
ncbi:TPA: AlpA family phage regulatory protein [Escherichia coli]|nr:AlpA family phage regulatory protein [Escherichia coli]HEL8026014.1 AlpA family phage regulatory protein [Escherichia coli]HEL8040383.1 AlpA family phage regulatory protein [Escherichia coli]HEL8049499.1 AlpA family phage regulatory protein [Escherichia coli]HEL8050239.1 AlpA family phage regulatory protein [Escherichia coli]